MMFMVVFLGFGMVSTTAEAKKKSKAKNKIELTGVSSLDKIFKKARTANKKLKSAEKNIRSSKKALRSALKLGKKATYKDGLRELKAKAKGKLKVVMVGGVPTLKAKEAIPSDIQAGVDAVNRLTKTIPATIRDMKAVASASTKMVKHAKNLNRNLQKEVMAKSGSGLITMVIKIPKIAKTSTNNLRVISRMPGRAKNVSEDLGTISNSLRKTFKN